MKHLIIAIGAIFISQFAMGAVVSVAPAVGTISGVTAGNGLTGGGTSGTVTVTVTTGTSSGSVASYGQFGVYQIVFSSEVVGGTSTSSSFANAGSSASVVAKLTGTKNLITVTGTWAHSSITAQSQIGIARNNVSLFAAGAAIQLNDGVIGKLVPYFVQWVDPTTNTAGAQVNYQTQIATSGATLTTGGAAATGSATTMVVEEIQ